jgi:hypothetical protein
MSGPNGGGQRNQSSPARDPSQAIPTGLFPSSESAPEVAIPREEAISAAWAIPRKRVGHTTPGTKAGKLRLAESGGGARKSWTIPTGRESGEALRVRRSDAGYTVSLRFRDGRDELREPYLCYLTASEWREAKQGSLDQMVRRISEKMKRREETPLLVELIGRLEGTAMNGVERRNAYDRAI